MNTEVRLRGVLNDRWAVPDPARKLIGKGSIVTVVVIGELAAETSWQWPGYVIDEWGQLVAVNLRDVLFEAPTPKDEIT